MYRTMLSSSLMCYSSFLSSLVMVSFVCSLVAGSGKFQLRIGPFQNDLGLTADGQCCTSTDRERPPLTRSKRPTPSSCPSACRTFFVVCLRHYQTNIIDDSTLCTYGTHTTDVWNSSVSHDPISFTFDFTWPGTFTLVVEAWHDVTDNGPQPGSHRLLISRFKMQRVLDAVDRWHHEELVNNIDGDLEIAELSSTRRLQQHRLRLEYRVACDVTFYGTGCDRLCVPRDDMFGHYDCDVTGRRVCHDGWNGTYCEKAICSEDCQGVCDVPFECKCRSGWDGPQCAQCIVYPGCQHGSCRLPWQCNCDEGWGGLFCNQDLNYCTTHQPCQNGGTCVHTGSSVPTTGSTNGVDVFVCHCRRGYTGARCEQEPRLEDVIDNCRQAGMSCLNGGTCAQRYNPVTSGVSSQHWTCRCSPGFIGKRCESAHSAIIITTTATPSRCNPQQRSCSPVVLVGAQSSSSSYLDVPAATSSSSSLPPAVQIITQPSFDTSAAIRSSPSSRVNDSLSTSISTRMPFSTIVDLSNANGNPMRWIVLSISLGAGLAVLLSAAALVGVVCRRHRKHVQRASTAARNFRNDVTGVTVGGNDVIKSTKMNNVVDASKISVGGSTMTSPAVRCSTSNKDVEASMQLDCRHHDCVIVNNNNNAKNEALTLSGGELSGDARRRPSVNVEISRLSQNESCDSPRLVMTSPMLILERIHQPRPPGQQMQQLKQHHSVTLRGANDAAEDRRLPSSNDASAFDIRRILIEQQFQRKNSKDAEQFDPCLV